MNHHYDRDDAAYVQGWQDGQRDLLRFFRKTFNNPKKLIAFAEANPAFNSAMITAVVAMLIAEGEEHNRRQAPKP